MHIPYTLPYANPVPNTALSIAIYLCGVNVTLIYGYLGNMVPDGTCEIDIAGLVVVLECLLSFCGELSSLSKTIL